LISKFTSKIDIKKNQDGIDYVSEALSDPRSQRDILTQSSMIFWMLIGISRKGKEFDANFLLLKCLRVEDPSILFKSEAEIEKVSGTDI